MGAPVKKAAGGSKFLRCLGDTFWTLPFLSALWCAPLILCFIYMRSYADDLWSVTDPMNINTTVVKQAWNIGFWVLIGVNAGAFLVTLFTSGKLLELLVSQSCCSGRARCFCNGFLLLCLAFIYLGTLLAVPLLLALETSAALLAMLVVQTEVACGYLQPADLQALVGLVSAELTNRVPPMPRFSLTADQIAPVCAALGPSTRSALIVVGLGFIAVLLQVLFATCVFSRLWAVRMEQKQVALCNKANALNNAASYRRGSGSAGDYRASISPEDEETGVWQESKFGPIEEEATGEMVPVPGQGNAKRGAFFANTAENRR